MSFEFKPFMFTGLTDEKEIAIRANAYLGNELATLPVAYGNFSNSKDFCFSSENDSGDKYKALIWDVQPIEPQKPCEHVPDYGTRADDYALCVNCGVKLKAEWKVI